MKVWIAEVGVPLPLDRTYDYEIPSSLRERVSVGVRVRAPFGPRRIIGTVLSVREEEPKRPLKPLESVIDPEPALTSELAALARWMSVRYCSTFGECLRLLLPESVLGKRERKAVAAFELPEPQTDAQASFELTGGQSEALACLSEALKTRSFRAHLLFGVPASGKTEVYLRLIRQAVAGTGQALFLVPEIALTRPFFEHFSASVFPASPEGSGVRPVALWHSRMSPRERREVWHGLRSGAVRVVVGPRSACLLPFKDLRLAVVDEEQDESYKQDGQVPYYHARDVVLERCRTFEAAAVLGSATPSVESFHQAKTGALRLIEMPQRVFTGTGAPPVRLLDRPAEGRSCIGPELLEALRERLQRREQSILLVNRRGFSNFAICRKCSWVARCPLCEVALIHHRDESGGHLLRCHHCGRSASVPSRCGQCGAEALTFAGIGTQKVAAEVRCVLPGVRVLRMDRDTVSNGADAEIYGSFLRGDADVLVGTKLVAKGFHFPRVTLVGVVDADTMLQMPDFRSSERTVQMLLQAAGRAGRAEAPGEVLLQTARPTDPALQAVARVDYAGFCSQELLVRRDLRYPPSTILVRVVFSGKTEAVVLRACESSADMLKAALGEDSVLGPAPGLLAKLRGLHRWHLLLKLPPERLETARAALRAMQNPSTVRVKVNVDPYDFV
ncbi:MAG: primosomal protein N' [Elusimicrobiota bacterium]